MGKAKREKQAKPPKETRKNKGQKQTAAGKSAAGIRGQEPKAKRASEFRFPKKPDHGETTAHPEYIYKKQGRKWRSLSITHDEKNSNRSKVKKLEKNPDPKDSREAKIKKEARTRTASDFAPRLKGWKFWTKKDQKTVLELIKKNEGNKQ